MAYMLPGVFLYDSDFNGKPYYVNEVHGLHLYFEDTTCYSWVLGPVKGEANGLMYSHSTEMNPTRVLEWQGNSVSGDWITLRGFQLKCTADSVPIDSLLTGTTAEPVR